MVQPQSTLCRLPMAATGAQGLHHDSATVLSCLCTSWMLRLPAQQKNLATSCLLMQCHTLLLRSIWLQRLCVASEISL